VSDSASESASETSVPASASTRFPWPPSAATGVGSHPGDDPAEALRTVLGELPGLPYLPELPVRGAGADIVGRSAALLVDLAVGLQPSGWRFTDRPGRDHGRARDFLARDLDTLEELAHACQGAFKVQVAGPWTLAGGIELRHGDKALADPGAVRDLTESLAEGVAGHLADVRRRLPGATVVCQVDEPGLPGVLAGTVPTASGFGRLAAVEAETVTDGLRRVLAAAGPDPIVHCCAPEVPFRLLRTAGARAFSFDPSLSRTADDEAIGEAVEAGIGLFLGVVPATMTGSADDAGTARRLWRRLGFAPELLTETVVVTPSCGLAGGTPARTRRVLERCREVARVLRDDPTG
jgi:methionine synthase II (cobalamin-independent)